MRKKILSDSPLEQGDDFQSVPRDIHSECYKQFKWNLYFYVSEQSGPFWAVLKLLWNSNMKFKQANPYTIQCTGQGISLKSERSNRWFKPWFNILLHTQSVMCATVYDKCLEDLRHITLSVLSTCWSSKSWEELA